MSSSIAVDPVPLATEPHGVVRVAGTRVTLDGALRLELAEWRSLALLATRATVGVTDLVEDVHRAVEATMGLHSVERPGARGIAGLVYRVVRGVASTTGRGLDRALRTVEQRSATGRAGEHPSRRRLDGLAVLNGIWGDRLAAERDPLALPMTLHRAGGVPLVEADATSRRVILFVHGLCRNDLAWQVDDRADPGGTLAEAAGALPLFLRYNTGRHVSENGRELSALLEDLVRSWPAPLEELSIVAHSMGGLVARSAVFSAQREQCSWPSLLRHLVFIGTPHHGAPLERIGHLVDRALGCSRWTLPFRRIGRIRSAGITDLRHGFVRDEDWQGRERFATGDRGLPTPLPAGVDCWAIAGTLAKAAGSFRDEIYGDGLVTVSSALGRHADPGEDLGLPEGRCRILPATGHVGLPTRAEVVRQLTSWVAPPTGR